METELGSKLSKVLGDFDSLDLLGSKNRAGPVFSSKETDTMFILSAHLKGYKRENIKVEIIESWTIITISGEYPIEESLVVGMKVIKKETKIRSFRKAFRIPVGVILNKIKARFNKHDSCLTISMPKILRRFSGVEIEEVKLNNFVRRQSNQKLQIGDDEVTDGEIILPKKENNQFVAAKASSEADRLLVREKTRIKLEEECSKIECRDIVEENGEYLWEKTNRVANKLLLGEETRNEVDGTCIVKESSELLVGEETRTKPQGKCCKVEGRDSVEESGESLGTNETRNVDQLLDRKETQNKLGEKEMQIKKIDEKKNDGSKRGKKPCSRKFCACCKFAGSALIVSLVFIVFHFVREKNEPNKKKNKSKI